MFYFYLDIGRFTYLVKKKGKQKMKFRKLLGGGLLAAVLALGGVAGLATRSESKNVKADETVYYLRGLGGDWSVQEKYKIIPGGNPLIIDLEAGDSFKVATSGWEQEFTTSDGDASGNGITFNSGSNSYVNTAGKYAFSVKDNALFADFGEFYYSGEENEWGIETSTTGNHPKVVVNGSSSTWTISDDDSFKIRNNNWSKGIFGYSNLADGDFYGSFASKGSADNINCKIAGSYDVSISLTNRTWTVRAVPHGVNPDDTAYVYVLDKYGDLLSNNHYAYTFDSDGRSMTWPGSVMQKYDGTNHMYQQEFWVGMDKVIFNNNDKQSWSWDVSGDYSNAGKCLILDGTVDGSGEWNSNTWVSPEVAKYIENCMHFANYRESEEGDGKCVSEGWYITARDAYQADSFAPFRSELCTLNYVVARLEAWAAANGATFTPEGGFVPSQRISPLFGTMENSTPIMLVVIISVVSLTAVGGYIFLKRRKED